NLYDESSGVVVGTELGTLPPAGQPFTGPPGREDRIFAALAIPDLAAEWTATAARGREALPGFLLRLATALVTSASIFPSGGQVVDRSGSRLTGFIGSKQQAIGLAAWAGTFKEV